MIKFSSIACIISIQIFCYVIFHVYVLLSLNHRVWSLKYLLIFCKVRLKLAVKLSGTLFAATKRFVLAMGLILTHLHRRLMATDPLAWNTKISDPLTADLIASIFPSIFEFLTKIWVWWKRGIICHMVVQILHLW